MFFPKSVHRKKRCGRHVIGMSGLTKDRAYSVRIRENVFGRLRSRKLETTALRPLKSAAGQVDRELQTEGPRIDVHGSDWRSDPVAGCEPAQVTAEGGHIA